MQINKELVIDVLIEQIKKDILDGDVTVLAEILGFVPDGNLLHSLPEETWDKYTVTPN